MLSMLKENGTFLLNTIKSDEELLKFMPNSFKAQLAKKHIKFYVIDANKIALDIGMGRHTNTILQSAFFYLNPQIMPYDQANEWMKKLAKKTYSKKGDEIVQLNYLAIDKGTEGLRQVSLKKEWLECKPERERQKTGDEYFDDYVAFVGSLDGYDLPTSAFNKFEILDGTMREDITFEEKRSIADRVPMWNKDYCIQCNQCAFACPHAAIRTKLIEKENLAGAPSSFTTVDVSTSNSAVSEFLSVQ